ncbi:MAG TPA: DMT family transporter [Chitinophagaceae bacterium]|nr:DMT family transporter [Chitinophagaceae bacterium]
MKGHWKAHAGLLLTNLLFGANYTAVKYITPRLVQPFGLNVMRVVGGTLLLWLLILFMPYPAGIRKEHTGRMLLCALTGVVVNQVFFIKGLSMTLSIHAALLMLITPVFIMLVAAWLIREPLTVYKLAGLALGIGGAIMLVLQKEHAGGGSQVLTGDLFIIINAISYAFFFVLVKPLMQEYDPLHVLRWMFTMALPFMVPIGWNEFTDIEWQRFTAEDYSALGFIVAGATFLAYLFNIYGISKLGASVAGAYIYTQPVFASLIAILVLGESFTFYKIIAASLIVGGVLLVNKKMNGRN